MKLNPLKIIIVTLLCYVNQCGFGQAITIKDTRPDSIHLNPFEVSFSFLIIRNPNITSARHTALGFNCNVLGYSVSPNYKLGISFFLDTHLARGSGFRKVGFRFPSVFKFAKNTLLTISPGIVASSTRRVWPTQAGKSTYTRGFSNEISLLFNQKFGITSRIDIGNFYTDRTDVEVGLGFKATGRTGIFIGGVVASLLAILNDYLYYGR